MKKLKYHSMTEPTTFSPRWWADVVRQAAWVILITLLIWVYADLEFTDVREFHVTLKLYTSPGKDVILADRREVDVAVRVRGNWVGMEQFENWLKGCQHVIRYDPSDTLGLGSHSLSVADVFSHLAAPPVRAVTVVSCQPAQVDVGVVRAVRKELPVKFSYAEATVESWSAEPNKVSVRASQEQWEKIQDALKANTPAAMETRTVDLKAVPADRPLTVEVVPAIAGVPVEVEPAAVRVTVQIGQKLEKKTLQVAVQVLTPPTWPSSEKTWKEFLLVGKDGPGEWQKTIEVSGPKKDIDQLTPAKVQAFIVLTDDDKKPTSWWSREVVVRFPDELQVKLVGQRPVVNFRLEKISPAAGATPTP